MSNRIEFTGFAEAETLNRNMRSFRFDPYAATKPLEVSFKDRNMQTHDAVKSISKQNLTAHLTVGKTRRELKSVRLIRATYPIKSNFFSKNLLVCKFDCD